MSIATDSYACVHNAYITHHVDATQSGCIVTHDARVITDMHVALTQEGDYILSSTLDGNYLLPKERIEFIHARG